MIKVLFLAGWGRSGSTILDRLLGQVDGFVSVGELYHLWDRGLLADDLCGCGQPFSKCEWWTAILAEAGAGADRAAAEAAVRVRDRAHVRDLLLGAYFGRWHAAATWRAEMMPHFAPVLHAIARRPGVRVVVDSSKVPTHAYLLDGVPEVELFVLHLVRDPRAVAFSWRRRKEYQPGRLMRQQSLVTSSLGWLRWNLAVEALWNKPGGRYLRLRYEDFVRQPRRSAEAIFGLLGEPVPDDLPFDGEGAIRLQLSHLFSGNPNRFQSGRIEIRADVEWRDKMSLRDRLVVGAITFPLLGRYGYLRPETL